MISIWPVSDGEIKTNKPIKVKNGWIITHDPQLQFIKGTYVIRTGRRYIKIYAET